MYIWIILAMFITALYSFNLHVRSDTHALYVEPQAQMFVSKIAVQHDTARRLFNYAHSIVKKCKGRQDCDGQEMSEEEQTFLEKMPMKTQVLKLNSSLGISNCNEYAEQVFLPRMNSIARIDGTSPANGAISMMFCLNSDSEQGDNAFVSEIFGSCEGEPSITCCYGKNAMLYVVTYAPLPIRWQERSETGEVTGKPSTEIWNAIRHFNLKGVDFGYITANNDKDTEDEESEVRGFNYVLTGFHNKDVGVPNLIAHYFEENKICVDGKTGCLVAVGLAEE